MRYEERAFIFEEMGILYVRNAELLSTSGNTQMYEGNIRLEDGTVIRFFDLGITVTVSSSSFEVSVSSISPIGETCGLCGTMQGVLLQSDRQTVADPMNRAQVDQFANSYMVPTAEQMLRSQRGQCGKNTC